MTTKKVRRGRPKIRKEKVNPYLGDEENILLNSVKPKESIMSGLNKRKLSKYELDEIFMLGDEDDEDV
jgi:hypothetical protein